MHEGQHHNTHDNNDGADTDDGIIHNIDSNVNIDGDDDNRKRLTAFSHEQGLTASSLVGNNNG
eukprot:2460408-Karenia_brevis.AAC.1